MMHPDHAYTVMRILRAAVVICCIILSVRILKALYLTIQ